MKVLKFGGTSVGSPDAIKNVLEIVKSKSNDDQLVVVVSAFSGVTNQLSELPTKALEGFEEAELLINELHLKHQHAYEELVGDKESQTINQLIKGLIDVCKGINLLQEITEKSRDFIMTMGELLSSHIVFSCFQQHLETAFFNTKDFLITQNGDIRKRADLEASLRLIKEIKGLKKINIFPGFIASKSDGTITSLGRGGSDYTASLLANLFNSSSLEIWTDVDGIMSADPKYVKQAKPLAHISYEEALEISHFGAKVIYPPSIQPALNKGIPITIKNTFQPGKEGTFITKEWDQKKTIIQGISSIKNVATINLSGSGMVGIPSFSARFFKALANQQINIIMITQASSEHSICVAISIDELERALTALKDAFHTELSNQAIDPIEVDEESAIVALVGSNMRNQVGVSGKMFHTLGKNGISIQAIAQGSSERNISAIIPQKDLKKALNTLHESFFLSERKRVNLFVVGVGNVGRSFLDQVKSQAEYLIEHFGMRISIAGIANSKKMLFHGQGINLANWQTQLASGETFEPGIFINQVKTMNLRNSIFIDITASHEIPKLYKELLCCNVSVVTPNKIGASGPYKDYKELLEISHRNNALYLFETNVGAGLPVISTLKDLIRSGDKIHRIEAVLSGTLNYLFNTYDGTEKFVEVIKDAKAKGLTEPDPRLDLFGEDVKRKILILGRESGGDAEMEEVKLTPFVPQECIDATDLEAFYKQAEKNENYFLDLYKEAQSKSQKLRVVASLGGGNIEVALKGVSDDHPFYHLEGKDNIVLFYTDRYKEQPLVIKGAGAGAEVTASGIFADILKTSMD